MASTRKNEFNPNVIFPPGGQSLGDNYLHGKMTQADLAYRLDVTEKHVTDLIKGSATITDTTAEELIFMENSINIERMSKEEKLIIMEKIWEDLSKNDTDLKSPSWHQRELQRTEERICAGQEKIMDWEEAKKELRKISE
jgi:plasmid maintenance system antidote protein VapI